MPSRLYLSLAVIFTGLIGSMQTQAQTKVAIKLTPNLKQTVNTRPEILGQNMNAVDWHGIKGRKASVLYNPKTKQIDADWLPLINAFPMHQLRWHMGNQYRWKNSVGPIDQRKAMKHDKWNLWFRTEAGLDEYLSFFSSLPQAPKLSMIASPLRPINELADLVAYCNATEGPMADWRKANGHPEPYHVKRWEMGNEIDYTKRADVDIFRNDTEEERKGKITVDQYIELIKPRIQAMRKVDPTIQIYVHAQTAPWFTQNPKWPQWHQTILKEIGDQIDGIVIHPYYDGYSVPLCLKSVDQLINDIRELAPAGKNITVWVNEHARWVNFKNKENYRKSWSMQGAISSADFLIELMKRPQVGMANYWAYLHRGPWRVINANWDKGATQKFGTAIHGMFQIFNQALLPTATPLDVDEMGFNPHPKNYTYNVSAMLFTDPKTKAVSLLTVNRHATQDFEASITLPKLATRQARQWILTGESLASTNVPQTPNATDITQSVIQTQQDFQGNLTLTIPAKSVVMWRWE